MTWCEMRLDGQRLSVINAVINHLQV